MLHVGNFKPLRQDWKESDYSYCNQSLVYQPLEAELSQAMSGGINMRKIWKENWCFEKYHIEINSTLWSSSESVS